MKKPDRIEILQNMPVFGGIRRDIVELILSKAEIIKLKKGEYFFKEDDDADCFFVLEKGQAIVIKEHMNHEYYLKKFMPGDCFGEMALIDLSPRSATVKATEDCLAIKLTTQIISSIYKTDIEQFTMIQMNMGREVSRRLRETDKLLFENLLENNRVSRIFDMEE